METTTRQSPIQLTWNEKDRTVTITPEDEDRFMSTVQDVICAGQLHHKVLFFKKQVDDLIQHLAEWLTRQVDLIHRAYLTLRDKGFMFVVEQKAKEYNAELESALTELDLDIAHNENFDLIMLSVLALPKSSQDSITSFISPIFSVVFPDAE